MYADEEPPTPVKSQGDVGVGYGAGAEYEDDDPLLTN
jgi:hypothetical protein